MKLQGNVSMRSTDGIQSSVVAVMAGGGRGAVQERLRQSGFGDTTGIRTEDNRK
jgi:hypothetical protein